MDLAFFLLVRTWIIDVVVAVVGVVVGVGVGVVVVVGAGAGVVIVVVVVVVVVVVAVVAVHGSSMKTHERQVFPTMSICHLHREVALKR